jgi:hypothetical protein
VGTLISVDPEMALDPPEPKPKGPLLTRERLAVAAAIVGAAALLVLLVDVGLRDREAAPIAAAIGLPPVAPTAPALSPAGNEVTVRRDKDVGAVLDNPATATHQTSTTPKGFPPSPDSGDNARYGGLRPR